MVKKGIFPVLRVAAKIALSTAALWLVFRKIETGEMIALMGSARPAWLLLAVLLFNASQWFSAGRLNLFLRSADVRLPYFQNLVLYYVGMFYNLFLPGGIGGDGYKVYLLNRHFDTPVKKLILLLLHDRLSGLAGLLLLLLGLMFAFWPVKYINLLPAVSFLMIAAIAVYIALIYRFFSSLRSILTGSFVLSILIQGLQVLAALALFFSLGGSGNPGPYLMLFLCSSIAAVLPFTIGGIGARELVFVYGYQYLQIDQHLAVALSLLFFMITAISSLAGIVMPQNPLKGAGERDRNRREDSPKRSDHVSEKAKTQDWP